MRLSRAVAADRENCLPHDDDGVGITGDDVGNRRPQSPDGYMFAENACTEAHHRMADSLAVLASLIDCKIKDRPQASVIAVSDVRDMTEEAGSRSWPQSSPRAAGNLHHFRIASSHSHAVDLAGYLQRIASSVLHFFLAKDKETAVSCDFPSGAVFRPGMQRRSASLRSKRSRTR